jgi:hypothetical protein
MFGIFINQQFVAIRHLFIFLFFHSTFLTTISTASNNMVQSPSSYIHYVHRYPHHPPSPLQSSMTTDPKFLAALLERSRAQRDTYDERQKLVSTYKIISKTQCLLQMRSTDGYVDAKHVTNLDDTQETKEGKIDLKR